jgi:hypothetical protein
VPQARGNARRADLDRFLRVGDAFEEVANPHNRSVLLRHMPWLRTVLRPPSRLLCPHRISVPCLSPLHSVLPCLPLRPFVTRGDYGLGARRKYWFEVQFRDRRSPVLANILFYPYFFL